MASLKGRSVPHADGLTNPRQQLSIICLNRKGKLDVTCSVRRFIVGSDDILYRLAGTKFAGMLDDPESHRLPSFASQRVRMVEAIVELRDRVPCGIVRLVYEMLQFDAQGKLDRNAFERQNAALVNLLVGEPSANDTVVVNASSRFIAQGGQWRPSPSLARRVRQAALGEIKCERLHLNR